MALKELGVAKEHRSTMEPDVLQGDRSNVMSRANPDKSMSPCNMSASGRGVRRTSRQAIINQFTMAPFVNDIFFRVEP